MARTVIVISAILVGAGIGLLVGYVQWGKAGSNVQHVEQRLQESTSEADALRQQKQELEQRVKQLSQEQERLAQENEILRKQETTQALLSGKGGELPERPPK